MNDKLHKKEPLHANPCIIFGLPYLVRKRDWLILILFRELFRQYTNLPNIENASNKISSKEKHISNYFEHVQPKVVALRLE